MQLSKAYSIINLGNRQLVKLCIVICIEELFIGPFKKWGNTSFKTLKNDFRTFFPL